MLITTHSKIICSYNIFQKHRWYWFEWAWKL